MTVFGILLIILIGVTIIQVQQKKNETSDVRLNPTIGIKQQIPYF
jgi:hypothetical protein